MNASVRGMAVRYLGILLAVLLVGAGLANYLMLSLTLYPLYWALNPFYPATLIGNSILFGDKTIEIIPACLGTMAILLLFALNLATPSIKLRKRALLFISSTAIFVIFNWARIFLLSILYLKDSLMFNQVHLFTWYFGSTLAVVLIWLGSIKLFKIKEIPFVSDANYLIKQIT